MTNEYTISMIDYNEIIHSYLVKNATEDFHKEGKTMALHFLKNGTVITDVDENMNIKISFKNKNEELQNKLEKLSLGKGIGESISMERFKE